jgi:hypothetical protein
VIVGEEVVVGKRRTWVWIIAGIAVVLSIVLVTVVALGVMAVVRSADVRTATPKTASGEFDDVRARFQGQAPLLAISGDEVDDRELTRRSGESGTKRAETLRVLAWSARDGKLVRLSMPLWVLRFSSHGRIEIGEGGFSLEKVRLDPETLRQIGPALLLDAHAEEADVLLWTEGP